MRTVFLDGKAVCAWVRAGKIMSPMYISASSASAGRERPRKGRLRELTDRAPLDLNIDGVASVEAPGVMQWFLFDRSTSLREYNETQREPDIIRCKWQVA